MFTVMTTWKRGRELVVEETCKQSALAACSTSSQSLLEHPPMRVPRHRGLPDAPNPSGVPHALLHNLKHNKVLHERVCC